MNYNELLNKLSSNLGSIKTQEITKTINENLPKEDTTPTLLNQIGLEVQRQGGH